MAEELVDEDVLGEVLLVVGSGASVVIAADSDDLYSSTYARASAAVRHCPSSLASMNLVVQPMFPDEPRSSGSSTCGHDAAALFSLSSPPHAANATAVDNASVAARVLLIIGRTLFSTLSTLIL